ncbi:TRAP transporter small permease [Salinicola avicenniae]|uniref:TRAP transporter small permease n=1 Tax=Salinicola avicenniae TaxID=2916836 RepID=UPI0020739BA4|nr:MULTISPECIES: TRAP transporter small permease subunit [unclassified Salinicola]
MRDALTPLQRLVAWLDRGLWSLGGLWLWLCNGCLLGMLTLTAATFLLRPFDISVWWFWPWTMVLFIWLSFLGFFAIHVRLKDVRIDFLVKRLGRAADAISRLLADAVALGVCLLIVQQWATVLGAAAGYVEGALLPGGEELPRQALFVPLFISCVLVALTALVDIAKLCVGLPENHAPIHPEVAP